MTTRRLNIKFLTILGVGSVLFLAGVYFLHEFQVTRNAKVLLRRAQTARDEGDLAESARLRMRYLSHVPDDALQYKETALDLKQSLFDKFQNRQEIKKRDIDLAVKFVSEAVTFNGKDEDVRREASDFWFQFRTYNVAVENLEQIDREKWTDDDLMRYINSLRLMGGPMEDKALDEFQNALGWNRMERTFTDEGNHPNLLDAYQSLVMLLMEKDLDREAAVKVLDRMVELNPDDPQAYLVRSRLIRFVLREKGLDRSYADVQTAYDKAPEDLDVIQSMSAMMLETDRAEDAKRLVELGLTQAETVREKSRLYRLLSEVYITANDIEGALKVLDRGNGEVPRDPELLWNKARILSDQKRHDDVRAMFRQLKDAGHEDPMIGYLQARILMDEGEYLKATRGLEKIRDVLPGKMQYEADIYLSEGYGRLGKYDLQLATFRNLRERYPDNEKVNQSYLQMLLQLRRTGEAQAFVQGRIVELNAAGKPIPKEYEIALTTLRLNDAQIGASTLTNEEEADLDKQLEQYVGDESLSEAQRQTILLRQLRRSKDPKVAKSTLQRLINKRYKEGAAPDDASTYLLWAMLVDFAENEAEATRFFGIMKSKVDNEKYGAAMASMRTKIALKHAPDTVPTLLKETENNIGQFKEHEQLSLLYEMGKICLATNRRDEALRLFEKSLTYPNASRAVKADILNVMFEDAMSQGDPDLIGQLVNRIRELVGKEDESYRIVEARRIVWNIRNNQTDEADRASELARARSMIESIRNARKEWLPGILVEADLHQLDNNPKASIELLEIAHNFQPNNARIIRAIASSYRLLRDSAKADEWMMRLPRNLRNETDNRLELTTLWVRRNIWTSEEAAKAIELLESFAPADSEDLKNQLLRSQVYLHVKQLDKAIAAAESASKIDPQMPDVWTNLVSMYKQKGATDKAAEVIQRVELELPEAMKPVVLGRCYAILGDLNKSQQMFLTALQADATNARVKRMLAETLIQDKKTGPALKVIQSIIADADKKEKAGEAIEPNDLVVLFWARRSLSKLLASTNSYPNFLQALNFLEKNNIDGDMTREDLSLFVSFCYGRPEKSSWDRALLRLDKLAQKRKLNDDEIFMKAQILERYGDEYWDDVKKMATDVLARKGHNKAAVENLVRWLLKRGEVKEAEAWSERNLDRTAVTRFRVDLHADAKRGDFERAAKKIQQRLPQSLDQDAAKSQQLTLAAITEELGQYDNRFYKMAESLLRKLAASAPSESLRVATLIGARGDSTQVKEALQMCIDAQQNQIADLVSTRVAVNILRRHPDDWDGPLASSIQDLSRWMESISAAAPNDALLQWRVAEFYDLVGNLNQAEVKYNSVLNSPEFKNPTDRGMVLNNLAYVMALNGKGAESMEHILQAEKLLPPSADLMDTKGYVHLVNGETDKAISAFQQAINSGPTSGHKYFHLALAYVEKNDRKQAGDAWKEALAIGLERSGLPPKLRSKYDQLASDFGGVATRLRHATR